MPRAGLSAGSSKLDIAVDLGNPLLNRTVDGFLKIGAVGACRVAAEDAFDCLDRGNVSKRKLEQTLKKMCKKGAYWGAVAGVYVGMEYGVERVRGEYDWSIQTGPMSLFLSLTWGCTREGCILCYELSSLSSIISIVPATSSLLMAPPHPTSAPTMRSRPKRGRSARPLPLERPNHPDPSSSCTATVRTLRVWATPDLPRTRSSSIDLAGGNHFLHCFCRLRAVEADTIAVVRPVELQASLSVTEPEI